MNYNWISQFAGLSRKGIGLFFANDRLFPFALDEGIIYPGTASENETVLFLLETSRLLRLRFDAVGHLTSHDVRAVPEQSLPWFGPKLIGTGKSAIPDFRQNNAGFLRFLRDEFAYVPNRINIRQFTANIDCDTCIYVDPLPMILADFIQDPSDVSCFDDLDAARETLRHWITTMQFVFEWGNDSWMNSEGRIVST